MNAIPPIPQERVLSTLNQDGTRRRIRPKLYQGSHLFRRRLLGWGLIVLFVGLPFVRINQMPAVFLNLAAREFTFFGRTFFATDGVLLMFLMLSIFVGILAMTALIGRAWCGWGCPQTVYMEFLFRPIERLFEGNRNAQLKLDKTGGGIRRALKNVVFFVLSVFVANVFLAYFVGTDTLFRWMTTAPAKNIGGFTVMAVTAGLVFFDFAYFREQMCIVACPYARLQAALLDKDSLIIGYDLKRGEPRHKGKSRDGDGDCVDCSACVVACPTGIDIRDGLQLECIACAQCIDACNTIMPKVKKPLGLIRYTSQESLAGRVSRVFRPRVLVYAALMTALLVALFVVASGRKGADVMVLRGIGAPFVLTETGVRNQVRVKIENRSSSKQSYQLEFLAGTKDSAVPLEAVPLESMGVQIVNPENPLIVEPRGHRTTTVFVSAPVELFSGGKLPMVVQITEPDGTVQLAPYPLLGPDGPQNPTPAPAP